MSETGARKWIIVITVVLASLLELIDSTVVNVALTQIMGNLGGTLEDVAWVVTAYAVANVIIVPMTGWLSSKFGRRNYFAFSIVLFTLSSFFCGHAHSIWELVAFRFIQGIGGGALLSTSQAILMETFKPEEAGMANAIFGLGVIAGPTIGPTLGGWITDNFSWPWIFYINVPLGIIATLLTLAFIRDSKHERAIAGIDWWGIFLLVTGIGALQIVLERGQAEDWFNTPYIVVLTFVSAVSLVGFVWWELTTEHPVVDLRILKNRSLSIGMLFTFILGFGLFASVFVFPIFIQNLLGFTAEQTGLILLPGSLMTAFMMPFIGIMMKKGVPPNLMAGVGFVLFFISTTLLSHSTLVSGKGDFWWPLIFRGLGLSFLFVPLTTLALSSLRGKDIAQGAGLNNMMRQLGGSFGIAIMTTFISKRIALHRVNLLPNMSPLNNAYTERLNGIVASFMAKGYSLVDAQHMADKALEGALVRQSMLLSYMDAFYIVGIFFLICIPLLVFQKVNKNAAIPQGAH
jgi:DHA2 family multidrug resistance protein